MPTYEYKCSSCQNEFKVTAGMKFKKKTLVCGQCGKEAALQVSLTGYRRDHTIHGDRK